MGWFACCCCARNRADCEEMECGLDTSCNLEMIDAFNQEEGTTRNKVALLPGHSLMDWIRLGTSGKDLTGVCGQVMDVTEEELRKHNSKDSAWICLRGKVFNVTPYMSFHPGGVPELMRGVGKEATKLFNEIHPWVNYESILRKCFVGHLVKQAPPLNTQVLEKCDLKPDSKATYDEECDEKSVFASYIKMNWCQTLGTVRFLFQCRVSSPQVLIQLKEKHLRVLIKVKRKLHVFGFHLHKKVQWPCTVNMNTENGRLEVEFEKLEEGYWKHYGVNDSDHARAISSCDEMDKYHAAEIVSITQAANHVRVFVFKFLEKVILWVPIGHDIRIRAVIQGVDYAKQYTPIPPNLPHAETTVKHWHNHYICCMVKYYEEGALTPYLFAKDEHDVVQIGGISGTFNIRKLSHVTELYLIAAGSGLSPMLRLIVWAVSKKQQVKAMNLLYFNRYEEDIIWRKELNELSKKEKWFKVTYCLSRPPDFWTGLKGRVTEAMLQSFLPSGAGAHDDFPEFYVCACGPIPFTEMIHKYLVRKGYDKCSHCFVG